MIRAHHSVCGTTQTCGSAELSPRRLTRLGVAGTMRGVRRKVWRFRLIVGSGSLLAFAGAGSSRALAQADLSELHGYVEPCTIANYQEMFTECEACPASQADPQSCMHSLGRRGYAKKCRTRGNGRAWEEVWCVSKGTTEAEAKRGDMASALRPLNLPALLLAAALFGAFLWMWRAWSHERPRR
jgi:hypothetical protein